MLEDYDVVHAVSPEMAIPLVMFKGFEKPLIVTIHGSHRASLKAFMSSPMRHWTLGDFALNVLELPLHESTTRLCFGRSEKVVVCSFSTLAEIRKYERVDVSKATVIYNGVDFDDAERDLETNDETKYSDEKPTMLYAGRLFWMKGIHYVLEAFRKIKKDLEVRLRIFGKGPMQTSAADFVRQNNLQDDVFLGGFLPHRELIREIRLADAVVFPSLYESQPMFALEAMACGKPLVAFDLPYARELVSHGHNGLLARPADADDLAAKAKSVLQDRTLGRRIGRNAYTYVKCNHDWKKQAGKYLQLYEEA
jgi:glycosyltransferase involved in cell wall biosynthesis